MKLGKPNFKVDADAGSFCKQRIDEINDDIEGVKVLDGWGALTLATLMGLIITIFSQKVVSVFFGEALSIQIGIIIFFIVLSVCAWYYKVERYVSKMKKLMFARRFYRLQLRGILLRRVSQK